jgi:hypothetical protein
MIIHLVYKYIYLYEFKYVVYLIKKNKK